jgi:hypothetical protein
MRYSLIPVKAIDFALIFIDDFEISLLWIKIGILVWVLQP